MWRFTRLSLLALAFLGAANETSILDPQRYVEFVILLGYLGTFVYYLFIIHGGREVYLRPLPGLDALNEAVGRATEMGKPLMFVNGLRGLDSISTIAAVNILGLVAQRVAEYETPLVVANVDPVVYAAEREVVRDAFTRAGKPDAFSPDMVRFLAATQFAYTAATCGLMVRLQPATILLMGYFYAESLILAETGASVGAIQIAATDALTQLPFFVAACDYTLIGEELYAASAYLSREPHQLGSIKAQDFLKFIAAGTILLGYLETALLGTQRIWHILVTY